MLLCHPTFHIFADTSLVPGLILMFGTVITSMKLVSSAWVDSIPNVLARLVCPVPLEFAHISGTPILDFVLSCYELGKAAAEEFIGKEKAHKQII